SVGGAGEVGGEGESRESRREHQPARTRGGQLVADLSEPRREQDDPEQDGEREESLTRAMAQHPRLELAWELVRRLDGGDVDFRRDGPHSIADRPAELPLRTVWEDSGIAVTRDMQGSTATDGRAEEALTDAAAFFEAYLWESQRTTSARDLLAERGLRDQVIRAFGVGYAPVGPDVTTRHLEGIGYSPDELEAAGLIR